MHSNTFPRLGRITAALATAGLIAAVGAGSAAASTNTKTPYTTEYTSDYGKVLCTGTIVTNRTYPGTPTEGGREKEKCVSQEPGGKLTGYFTAGEEYKGYWESDYYTTIGEPGVQPTSVTIKVAKNFKSFRVVSATYAVSGGTVED
jgi:hypothetical protein